MQPNPRTSVFAMSGLSACSLALMLGCGSSAHEADQRLAERAQALELAIAPVAPEPGGAFTGLTPEQCWWNLDGNGDCAWKPAAKAVSRAGSEGLPTAATRGTPRCPSCLFKILPTGKLKIENYSGGY